MNEIKARIDLDGKLIQTNSVTFPFYADNIISVTQHWQSNTSNGRMYTKWTYNKKDNFLNIYNINTNLLDDSSYLEIIYFNQQLMRDKKIEEILK